MGLKPVRVSQLNNYIKRILQTDPILGNVSVFGEVSNLKFHGSGHVYFSLKDETSKINCFLPSNINYLAGDLKEGMEVILTGYIYLYERGGSYSFNVKDIEIEGQGELALKFEKLKKKLDSQGYFDTAHKKELPAFPQKLAVVTSETGAAVRDILKIIKKKNDFVDILIYPVLVQGANAAGEIAAALDDINKNYNDVDVIITGRGGGSMEELWAFNEEIVAESIYRSKIPVISAVGHETDFTIADFVADARAETPTAAADMAAPDTDILRENIIFYKNELKRDLSRFAEFKRKQLEALNPENLGRDIQSRIVVEQMKADSLLKSMEDTIKLQLSSCENRLSLIKESIEAINPTAILSKGYSVVTDSRGNIIKDICNNLKIGDTINIKAALGKAEACITDLRKE